MRAGLTCFRVGGFRDSGKHTKGSMFPASVKKVWGSGHVLMEAPIAGGDVREGDVFG